MDICQEIQNPDLNSSRSYRRQTLGKRYGAGQSKSYGTWWQFLNLPFDKLLSNKKSHSIGMTFFDVLLTFLEGRWILEHFQFHKLGLFITNG